MPDKKPKPMKVVLDFETETVQTGKWVRFTFNNQGAAISIDLKKKAVTIKWPALKAKNVFVNDPNHDGNPPNVGSH